MNIIQSRVFYIVLNVINSQTFPVHLPDENKVKGINKAIS